MSDLEELPDWKSLTGTTLEGGYELKEIVEAEKDRAKIRVRVLGDYTLKATARFYILERSAGQKQVDLWETIRRFERKADLSVPLGAGIVSLNGFKLPYLVSQNPDETLDEVLKARPLAPEEALEVLRSNIRGLGELHANGFVHGCLAPQEIFAIGNSIQLSTEAIREVNSEPIVEHSPARYLAPESGARNLTIASDVWCLGATLFENLTQKPYDPGLLEKATALPHPFGTLEARCLDPDPDGRCQLADIETILRSKPPAPKPKPVIVMPLETAKAAAAGAAAPVDLAAAAPPVVPPVRETAKPVEPAPAVAQSVMGAARASAAAAPSTAPERAPIRPTASVSSINQPRAQKLAPETAPRTIAPAVDVAGQPGKRTPGSTLEAGDRLGQLSGRRGWIYGAAAILILFVAVWLLRSRPATKVATGTQPGQAAQTASPSDTPGKAGAAWPTQTLNPDGKSPAPPSTAETRPHRITGDATSAASQTRTVWRVVLYTYHREQDADSRAKELAAKHPDLHPQVFAPGEGGPYLVVAGSGMDRQAASRLRTKAVREGMPHDTYTQNYNR